MWRGSGLPLTTNLIGESRVRFDSNERYPVRALTLTLTLTLNLTRNRNRNRKRNRARTLTRTLTLTQP